MSVECSVQVSVPGSFNLDITTSRVKPCHSFIILFFANICARFLISLPSSPAAVRRPLVFGARSGLLALSYVLATCLFTWILITTSLLASVLSPLLALCVGHLPSKLGPGSLAHSDVLATCTCSLLIYLHINICPPLRVRGLSPRLPCLSLCISHSSPELGPGSFAFSSVLAAERTRSAAAAAPLVSSLR